MNTYRSSKDRHRRDAGLRQHRRAPRIEFERLHAVVRATPVARRHIVPGAVVLARVPFSDDASQSKVRPVIVHRVEGNIVVVQPCSSSPERRRSAGAIAIADLRAAGLNRATSAIARIVRLDRADLLEFQGNLSTSDMSAILPWLTVSYTVAA